MMQHVHLRFLGSCLVLLSLLVFTVTAAGDPVPRILLAGDSWSALMQAFDTYQEVLPEFAGYENYRSIGFRTSVVGIQADEFIAPAMLATVAEELALYPTIDIVHLSLGGNDILYGRWLPSMSPEQQENLFNAITADIETAIDFILAQRPDIRVGLCGYSFADHNYVEVQPTQANQAITALERKKRAMVQSKQRVFYIHNLGLMQYTYGIPQADPPIPPHSVPYPGGYPEYDPMPGGNILYTAPAVALVDGDVHLTPDGYKVVARRCMDEFYAEWLSWPRVLEVQLLSTDAAQAVFQVRFSEAVSGVDASDFAPSLQTKALSVLSVSGSGDLYTAIVSLDGGPGTVHLDVLDDDTIRDLDNNPLGGPGTGNGLFSFNGTLSYQDPPPIEEDDFDAFLLYLDTASAPYTEQLNGFSFAPEVCDANGGFQMEPEIEIYGNGLLESCEFGLIQACLRDPDLDLRPFGGISHEVAFAAWQQNLTQMRTDLGGTDGLALSVLRGLDSILSAYFLLGDSVSRLLPSALVFAAVSYEEISLELTVPDPMNYRMLPRFFAFSGDADGDGFTNKEEYDYFMPLGGRDLYVRAALTPFITPESTCANTEGGVFSEGDMFCLVVPDPVSYTTFQWMKDGQPLNDIGSIQGSRWRTLHIMSLSISDSGDYTCEYDDGSKSPRVFGPVHVEVIKTTPTATPGGLFVLLALFVLIGITALYCFRPKHSA